MSYIQAISNFLFQFWLDSWRDKEKAWNRDINILQRKPFNRVEKLCVKASKIFSQNYCDYCLSNILPKLRDEHKESLSEGQSLSNVIANWDISNIANVVIDLVRCFVPEGKTTVAVPNARRLIQRPMEHSFFAHFLTQSSISLSKGQKQTKRLQSVLQKDLSPKLTINKVVVVVWKISGFIITIISSSSENLHWFTNKRKMKFQHVGRSMSHKLSMSKGLEDLLDTCTKGFYFSMVHVGVSKCSIYNATIIDNYQKAIEGI